MNGMGGRDAAFLQEMGIGPLWQLRAAPPAAAEPGPGEAMPAMEPQAEPGTGAQVEARAEPRTEPRTEPQAEPQSGRPAEPQGRAASAAPAGRVPVRDDAWGDVTPYAVQGAAPPPAAPAEDMAADEADIAGMDWDQLHAAVAACTRCGACRDDRKPVFGDGARQARWLVAAGATTPADEQEGRPLAGEPGKLLDNMLFAAGLERGRDVYVTSLVKCRPASANGGDRAPTAAEAAACRPFLERELALTGASAVLTLGQVAANALLGKPLQEPLASARGGVHALAGVPLVATLHPGELLRRGADKALAWADLCRARAADARRD
jgi:DNA polymerase